MDNIEELKNLIPTVKALAKGEMEKTETGKLDYNKNWQWKLEYGKGEDKI